MEAKGLFNQRFPNPAGYGIVGRESTYDAHKKGSDNPSNDGANYYINASHSHTAGSSGGGNSHNVMQPYEVVFRWKRTA